MKNPIVDHMLQDDEFMESFEMYGKLDEICNKLDSVQIEIASLQEKVSERQTGANNQIVIEAIRRFRTKIEKLEKTIANK